MRVISSTAIALVLASTAAVFCAPVHAETKSVEVSYSDLDLSTAAGVAALNGRIDRAVRKICGYASTSLTHRAMWKSCVAEARSSAQPQLALAITKANREAFAFRSR